MEVEHDDAVSHLEGLALGQVLEDLGVVGNQSDLRHIGLGSKASTAQALNKDEIYRNDFDDDAVVEVPEDDDEAEEEKQDDAPTSRPLRHSMMKIRGEDDDFADEDEEEQEQVAPAPPPAPAVEEVREKTPPLSPRQEALKIFPDFAPGKVLNYTDLFVTPSQKRRRLQGKLPEVRAGPSLSAVPPPSGEEALTSIHAPSTMKPPKNVVARLAKSCFEEGKVREVIPGCAVQFDDDHADRTKKRPGRLVNNVEVDDWERRIVQSNWRKQYAESLASDHIPKLEDVSRPRNAELANGAYFFESIIWNPYTRFHPFDRLIMDMNDADMILENEQAQEEKQVSLLRADAPPNLLKSSKFTAELDPFNLSNDRMYELSKEHRHRVRQTLGQLVVRHAWPAIKLQLPFYKMRLAKHETRSWHRPLIQFPSNMPITFSKVRSSRKKDGEKKSKDPSEVLHSTRDLTLKDASNFVLCEYSEEYPPLLSNLGMGSLLVNYYRKKDSKDDHIPRAELGEAFVLDTTDESPFMKFGSVEPGQTQPVLYNNMTRAPLFRHKPQQNDFLFIRSTTKTDVKYYLRDIPYLFTVGQTYPTTPIPGPHARLVTNNVKHRLRMITYKLLEKSPAHRIKIHRVMKYFPDHNELQMRQRLNEFMVFHRKSGDKHQGFWRLKPNVPIPDEAELQKLLTPEHICLVEGMQVGQRHLLDAGFTKTAEGHEDDSDETKLDIEQLLAPWITSKNFLHATQGKAMLKLHGDGDPSGRGEAFSFVRVSMKEIFLRAGEDVDERLAAEAEARAKSGHRYNVAEQQAIYRSEIARIWKAQLAALSNPVPPRISAKEEQEWNEEERRHMIAEQKSSKPLLVRRLINGVWYKHIVRNPAVVNAYVKQRKEIEEQSIMTESLVPTGDAALDALRKKRLEDDIAALVKNQGRRLQRKNAKAAAEGLIGGYKNMPNKTNTKRRCGRCGMVGHMATNNACPQYPQDNNGDRSGTGPGGAVRPPSVMPMPNSTYYTNANNQQNATMPNFQTYGPMGSMGPP
ncbi:uncharacterized protein MJAP1_003393 [Malassezia japonica]|uniref:Transcription initiation factor TFIID subunit 1 histone acetyltransferase domain-containing protein n=1 Tax=Malassezia japonica TaxID=223818 RepID=A0AAF0JB07_9BASI|nr:uncharacterized protein MJAP1_003393 [Malassezia japonica]WFD40407.1 hypothetical protein MJAP1_003393 [Malassezia japonica]